MKTPAALVARLRAFLGPVAGSVRGSVNTEELIRIVYAVATSGAVTSIPAFLVAILSDKDLFTAAAPTFVVAGAAAIVDLLRRLDHETPTP